MSADKVIVLHAGVRTLTGPTRNMLSIADWLSCRGHQVEVWGRCDDPYVASHPAYVRVVIKPPRPAFAVDRIREYYDLACAPEFKFKNYPTASIDGDEIVFPEDQAKDLSEAGFITDMEVYNFLPEDLRLRGTLYIDYPNITVKKWAKMFTDSRFSQELIYRKCGVAPQVFYPPVRNVFSPNQTKDLDFVIYSRLSAAKLQGLKDFLSVHGGRRIVIMGADQGLDLSHYNVTVVKNATRLQIKQILERAKNYIHFYTRREGGEILGEPLGQTIVEALYAGAQPWIPNVPSGALEIPGILTYTDFAEIRVTSGVDDKYIRQAMRRFDPTYREGEVERLLPHGAKHLSPSGLDLRYEPKQ